MKSVLTPILEQHKSAAPSRYKEEPKKPWILAYYALMSGTQKRQARLEEQKLVKRREAEKARIELMSDDERIMLPNANQTN
jgi:hypothetical protein